MPSLSKSELLALVRTGHQNLTASLDEIGATRALLPGADGDWSVKDVVSHLAHWEGVTAGELAQVARGEMPPTVDFNRIHILNAEIQAADCDRSLADPRAALDRATHDLLANAAVLSEDVLARKCMWANEESIAMQAASEMYHWRGHIKRLRHWFDMVKSQ